MYQNLNRIEKIFFDVCATVLVLFYAYAAVIKPMATQYHRGVYIIITYVLVFLLYKSKNKILRVVDYILIVLSAVSVGYWIFMFEGHQLPHRRRDPHRHRVRGDRCV